MSVITAFTRHMNAMTSDYAGYTPRVPEKIRDDLPTPLLRRLVIREMAVLRLRTLRRGLDPAEQRELDRAVLDHAEAGLRRIEDKCFGARLR